MLVYHGVLEKNILHLQNNHNKTLIVSIPILRRWSTIKQQYTFVFKHFWLVIVNIQQRNSCKYHRVILVYSWPVGGSVFTQPSRTPRHTYIRLYLLMTVLQLGQLWVTSLQPSTQNGMKQQPRSHPTIHRTRQMIQVNVPVSNWVAVTTSAWQWGQRVWTGDSRNCCTTVTAGWATTTVVCPCCWG